MVKRNIEFDIDTASWSLVGRTVPPKLILPSTIDINLLEILLHVAKRTSLPISFGFTLGDLWAWLRYLPAISNDTDLRLREEWEEIDPHQKTILSDDMGMGFSSAILSQCLDLLFICPTNYVVKRHPHISLGTSGKRGPDKSPDFMAVDIIGNLHVFECKGTQKNIITLEGQLNTGFAQKNNIIDPKGLIDQRLVSGIFIPQFNNKESAIFKIKDPEFKLNFSSVTKEEVIETIILGEIASSLHLFGFPKIANSIAQNKRPDNKELEKFNKEITKLDNVVIDGEIHKKITILHRVDYTNFINENLDGIRIHIGMKSQLINKLLSGLDPIDIAKELRLKIQNQQININIIQTNERWSSILSPMGLFMKLELE